MNKRRDPESIKVGSWEGDEKNIPRSKKAGPNESISTVNCDIFQASERLRKKQIQRQKSKSGTRKCTIILEELNAKNKLVNDYNGEWG